MQPRPLGRVRGAEYPLPVGRERGGGERTVLLAQDDALGALHIVHAPYLIVVERIPAGAEKLLVVDGLGRESVAVVAEGARLQVVAPDGVGHALLTGEEYQFAVGRELGAVVIHIGRRHLLHHRPLRGAGEVDGAVVVVAQLRKGQPLPVGREGHVVRMVAEGALLRHRTGRQLLHEDIRPPVVRRLIGQPLPVLGDGKVGIRPPVQTAAVVADVRHDELLVLLVGNLGKRGAALLGHIRHRRVDFHRTAGQHRRNGHAH